MSTSAYLGTGSPERSSAWTARLTSSKYGATGRTEPERRTENGQPLSPAWWHQFAPLSWNLCFIACADGMRQEEARDSSPGSDARELLQGNLCKAVGWELH